MPSKRLLKAILPLLTVIYSLNVYSQTKQITGSVKDSKGAGVVIRRQHNHHAHWIQIHQDSSEVIDASGPGQTSVLSTSAG